MKVDINKIRLCKSIALALIRFLPLMLIVAAFSRLSYGATPQIISDISQVKGVLGQLGPALSAMLFIVAGIFYAIGQMLPPDKKANFHTAAINIIIGAIVVGVLSFASTSLSTASTHILSNFSQINSTG